MKSKEKKSQPVEIVEMDLKKIFLTPPKGRKERITLLLVLLVSFMIFFGPICFSDIHPIKAIVLSLFPAISISWGWIILLRSRFQKKEYSK